mmetsp:Transcript_20671/g.69340  ORF Transcript_20671/g.69340 Transcript_20671/m.69340 type:complete len:202 (+) Transcript_20671:1479-2084(+)
MEHFRDPEGGLEHRVGHGEERPELEGREVHVHGARLPDARPGGPEVAPGARAGEHRPHRPESGERAGRVRRPVLERERRPGQAPAQRRGRLPERLGGEGLHGLHEQVRRALPERRRHQRVCRVERNVQRSVHCLAAEGQEGARLGVGHGEVHRPEAQCGLRPLTVLAVPGPHPRVADSRRVRAPERRRVVRLELHESRHLE